MPTNFYGFNNNLKNSHVLSALLRNIHDAKINGILQFKFVESGKPKRKFLFVDDLVEACLFLMKNYNQSGYINVGTEVGCFNCGLTEMAKAVIGFSGEICFVIGQSLMELLEINECRFARLVGLECKN